MDDELTTPDNVAYDDDIDDAGDNEDGDNDDEELDADSDEDDDN